MKRVFVIAMNDEASAVTRHLRLSGESLLAGRRVLRGTGPTCGETAVVVSGVGKVNAAAATQLALSLGADEIFNAGLAGGFGDDMVPLGVYEVARAVEYDFDLAALNHTAVGVLNERTSPYLPFVVSSAHAVARTLATGDRFSDSEADWRLIVETLGASLRDMEGAAIAHVCETASVPCRAIKCVTNVAGQGGMIAQFAARRAAAIEVLAEAMRAYV